MLSPTWKNVVSKGALEARAEVDISSFLKLYTEMQRKV